MIAAAELLLHAAFDKILPLRTDDLLIDRLLQTVEASLFHAELHLVLLPLTFESLRGGDTGKPFAACDRHRRGGIHWNGRSGGGGLRNSRDREQERAYRDRGTQQKSHGKPPIDAAKLGAQSEWAVNVRSARGCAAGLKSRQVNAN